MQAPEDRLVAKIRAVAQPAIERSLQQLGLVEIGECLRNRFARDVAVDAERLDLAHDAGAAAMLETRLRPSRGERRAAVVEGALRAEARDGGFDVLGIELTACQACAKLRFGQFAAGEQRQAGDIGAVRARRTQRPPNRVISGAPPPVCAAVAIWSRDMSAVVEMPCTLSLNSSTFDAQRSASS